MEKQENIDQYEEIRQELLNELTGKINKIDIEITKKKKEKIKCVTLQEKLNFVREFLLLEKKRYILRKNVFKMEDIINSEINECISKLDQ